MYAECPHCHAIFRITPKILRIASGKVRCGECDTVFDSKIDLESLEDEAETSTEIASDTSNETTDENSSPEATQLLEKAPDFEALELSTPEPKTEETAPLPLFASNPIKPNTIENKPSAVEIKPTPKLVKKSTGTKTFFAAVLSLLLLATLFSQYLYKNRAELATYDSLRPALNLVCSVANCTLPPQSDAQQIALLSHGVYSHPNIQQALMIKATIANEASFAQPLPIIELSLSNIRGKRMAMRRFTPQEYLPKDSELLNTLMGTGDKIPVSIQVKDPGKDALVFDFEFI